MKLIDMYVTEVGQNLPAKNRADIEAEIRSLLQDTLDERSAAAGRPVDDDLIVEVLKEFGPPARMAGSYLPPRYLIGPRLFPAFLTVMRILLALVGIVALVRLGVEISQPGITLQEGLSILGQNMLNFMTSILAALGNVVFVFAVLEWVQSKETQQGKAWDPRTLKPRSETEQVNRLLLAWSIAITLAALVLFNVYPEWIGILYLEDGQWHRLPSPVLSETFFSYLPLLNILWVLQIGLNLLLVQAGRWQPGTRWFNLGLKILNIIILVMMITGAPIVDLSPAAGPGMEVLRDLEPLAYNGLRALLVLILVLEGFDLVKMVYPLVTRRALPVVNS